MIRKMPRLISGRNLTQLEALNHHFIIYSHNVITVSSGARGESGIFNTVCWQLVFFRVLEKLT